MSKKKSLEARVAELEYGIAALEAEIAALTVEKKEQHTHLHYDSIPSQTWPWYVTTTSTTPNAEVTYKG